MAYRDVRSNDSTRRNTTQPGATTRSYYGTTPAAQNAINEGRKQQKAAANTYVNSLVRRAEGASGGNPYSEYGQMMQLAGMSNQAKFADGVAVGDKHGGKVGSGGGRGGRGGGGGAAAAAAAALAARMQMLDRYAQVARANFDQGNSQINSIYDELNGRLGSRTTDYQGQMANALAALQASQGQASQNLNAHLGRSQDALAAQFGGGLAASLSDGNAAQMAALQAALGQRQQLDVANQQRTGNVGLESLQQRVTDSGTARAGSLATNANNLGALLQEIEQQRMLAQLGAI